MALVPLTLSTLGDLAGGAVGIMVNADLATALTDLEDRAESDRKPRKICLEITLDLRADGNVEVDVQSWVKAPKRRSPSTVTKVTAARGGEVALVFQEYAPDRPEQRTMDDSMDNKE